MELNDILAAWLMFAAGMAAASVIAIGATLFFMDGRDGGARRGGCRHGAGRDGSCRRG